MTGLAAGVKIEHSEPANDALNVNGLDGNDTISGSVGLAALIKLGIDGGAGNDTINGGDEPRPERRRRRRRDRRQPRGRHRSPRSRQRRVSPRIPATAATSSRAKTATKAPTSSSTAPAWPRGFDVSANGDPVRFFRDVANITMNEGDIELIDVQALVGT